jgi:hypothetical protein
MIFEVASKRIASEMGDGFVHALRVNRTMCSSPGFRALPPKRFRIGIVGGNRGIILLQLRIFRCYILIRIPVNHRLRRRDSKGFCRRGIVFQAPRV